MSLRTTSRLGTFPVCTAPGRLKPVFGLRVHAIWWSAVHPCRSAFGSAARGEFRSGSSDYDFFVEFIDYNSPAIADQWFGLQEDLEALLIQAFAAEVVEAIEHEGIRDALMDATATWLGQRG